MDHKITKAEYAQRNYPKTQKEHVSISKIVELVTVIVKGDG